MIQIAFVLAVSVLGTSAFAQARVTPPSAWSTPIGMTGGAVGLNRVSSLGGVSLTRLLRPNADETVPVFTTPSLVAPIAAELEARGLTPESYSALWLDARLGVLSEAAKIVERRAASEASGLYARAFAPAKDEREVARIEAEAQALRGRSIYLGRGAEAALARVEAAIAEHRAAKARALETLNRDLPNFPR